MSQTEPYARTRDVCVDESSPFSLKCGKCNRFVRVTHTVFYDGVNPDPEMILLAFKCICGNSLDKPVYLRQEARK